MAPEATFSKKSLGYYQVKHSGNNPAANQIKERQTEAGGTTIFAFPQNKLLYTFRQNERTENSSEILRYFLWPSHPSFHGTR